VVEMTREVSMTLIVGIIILVIALAIFIYFAFFTKETGIEGIINIVSGIEELIKGVKK